MHKNRERFNSPYLRFSTAIAAGSIALVGSVAALEKSAHKEGVVEPAISDVDPVIDTAPEPGLITESPTPEEMKEEVQQLKEFMAASVSEVEFAPTPKLSHEEKAPQAAVPEQEENEDTSLHTDIEINESVLSGLYARYESIEHMGPNENQTQNYRLIHEQAVEKGWTGSQWAALEELVWRESQFVNDVYNSEGSGAYGLFQFMPFTWETYGCVATPDPHEQIRCGFLYIEDRYGTPEAALDYHDRNGAY